MNLKQKWLLSIMVVAITVLFIFSMFVYQQSAYTIEQNYTNSVVSSMNVSAATFDDIMREAYFAAVNIADSEEMPKLAAKKNACAEYLDRHLTGDLDTIYFYNERKSELICATPQGIQVKKCEPAQGEWIRLLTQNNTEPLTPISTTDSLGTIRKQVFLYTKPVISPKSRKQIGVILVTVDERIVYFKCLQNNQSRTLGTSYITTPHGYYVSCADINDLGKREDAISDSVLRTTVTAPLTGYRFVSVANRAVVTRDIRKSLKWIVVLLLSLISAAGVIVWIMVSNLIRPIHHLERTMERVGQGDLEVRAHIYHNDEIGRLSMGFNNMVKELNNLIGELVTERMLKKEAEIEALQYQIQPHFMYNTLNSIKYAAVLQNAKEIAGLLEAFIELLQLTASNRGTFITLRQEMHMVENYTKLQLFRYANSFEVVFDLVPESMECYVPALIIQPIVENAILHGIDLKKKGGRIEVGAMTSGDTLMIRVHDNGRGMTPEAIEQLMANKQRSKLSGIGMGNIRERLRLYYGNRAQLRIYSKEGEGTTMTISLPVSYNENEYTI